MSDTKQLARFQVGDKVSVPLAVGRVIGIVTEDRGPLGVAGRRLYRVNVPNDPYTPEEFTVGEDEIRPLSEDEMEEIDSPLAPDAIKEFLVEGGLVSILQRNSPEPVWIRRGPLGNLTYTFLEGFSATGGEVAPAHALYGERVFRPKKQRVVDFATSFGLSPSDAEEVVSRVGVVP